MMDMVYQWKPHTSVKADPQKVGERLEALRVRNNGHLSPQAVVRDARPKRSPLHPCFEWDDKIAAEQWRDEQARYILRSITVVVADKKEEKPVRAFVNVVQDDQSSYTSIAHAMSDADLRRQVLERAFRELAEWRRRYEEYEELAAVFAAADETVQRLAS